MAVKRRVIWMSDEEWAALTTSAEKDHTTVSQEIRDLWTYAVTAARGEEVTLYDGRVAGFGHSSPAPKPGKK